MKNPFKGWQRYHDGRDSKAGNYLLYAAAGFLASGAIYGVFAGLKEALGW